MGRRGRPHASPEIRMWMGDSRGHWEGDTLVIETTNLTDRTAIGVNGGGMKHSEHIRITEKLTNILSGARAEERAAADAVQ
jgi:hypothetical protein